MNEKFHVRLKRILLIVPQRMFPQPDAFAVNAVTKAGYFLSV
jgi:hypothetical protein